MTISDIIKVRTKGGRASSEHGRGGIIAVQVVDAAADRAAHGALTPAELVEKVVSTWTIKPTQTENEAGGYCAIEHGALTLD
jgi:hypothetical protein